VRIDREHVLAKLREQRDHVEREYGLRIVGLVGSVARGEATGESDVDVWVDILRTPTLFEIAHAENELADTIGAGLRVEFVFREDLRPALRARMERDLVQL
jgi:predicted nucleotidyltransferase